MVSLFKDDFYMPLQAPFTILWSLHSLSWLTLQWSSWQVDIWFLRELILLVWESMREYDRMVICASHKCYEFLMQWYKQWHKGWDLNQPWTAILNRNGNKYSETHSITTHAWHSCPTNMVDSNLFTSCLDVTHALYSIVPWDFSFWVPFFDMH